LKEKKIHTISKKYIKKLYCHDEYLSGCSWWTLKKVEYGLAGSNLTDKLNEVQEQVFMRFWGLGWGDLHHPLSKNNGKFTWQKLAMNLKKNIPQESILSIPECPSVNLPSWKDLSDLGTLAPNIIELDKADKSNEKEFEELEQTKRDELEEKGFGHCYAKIQGCNVPLVNEDLPEERSEILYTCTEPDGSQEPVLGNLEVVGNGIIILVTLSVIRKIWEMVIHQWHGKSYSNCNTSRALMIGDGGEVLTKSSFK